MRKECCIVIGENELASLLVSLDKEGRLNGNIIAVIGSDTDSCLPSEVANKFKDIGFECCIGLYTGACVNESLLVVLKSRCKEIYDVSLSYRDIQFATSLGLPYVSYTSFVQVRKGLYQLFVKRFLDILSSSFGIIIQVDNADSGYSCENQAGFSCDIQTGSPRKEGESLFCP